MNYFLKKSVGPIVIAGFVLLVPVGFTLVEMTDYDISDVSLSTKTVVAEVKANGDLSFEQKKRIETSEYHGFEQIIYFTADDDNESLEHDTILEANTVSVNLQNPETGLNISATSTSQFESGSNLIQFGWLPNAKTNIYGETFPWYDADSKVIFAYLGQGLYPYTDMTLNYTIKGAAIRYADTAELNWTIADTEYMKNTNVDVTVLLPEGIASVDDVYAVTNGSNQGRVESITMNEDNQVAIHVTAKRLFPGERIQVRALFPASVLSDVNASSPYGNYYPDLNQYAESKAHAEEALMSLKIYRAANWISLALVLPILAFAAYFVYRIYLKYDKEHVSDFYNEYYRELPAEYGPAMLGYLYNFKEISKNDVSATLMDLIRRKYITIDSGTESLTESKVNYTLILDRSKDMSKLEPHELNLIHWFFDVVAGGDTLTLNQLDKFTSVEANAIRYNKANQNWVSSVRETGAKYDFFDNVRAAMKEGAAVISFLAIAGFIALFLALANLGLYVRFVAGLLFAIAIILSSYFATIQRRSKNGNEEYVRWKAFKKFLEEFSNMKDYPMPGIIIWEHYMVYAVEFGIADLVEKQLRFKYKELGLEDTLNQSPYFRNPGFCYFYASRINRSFVNASTTIAQAQAQRANSSRGGGGRFGGGGGHIGGGGGGMRFR